MGSIAIGFHGGPPPPPRRQIRPGLGAVGELVWVRVPVQVGVGDGETEVVGLAVQVGVAMARAPQVVGECDEGAAGEGPPPLVPSGPWGRASPQPMRVS